MGHWTSLWPWCALLLLFPQTNGGACNSTQTIVVRPDPLHVYRGRREREREDEGKRTNQTQAHLCLSDWNPIGNHRPCIQEPSKTHTHARSRLFLQTYRIQTRPVCGMPVRESLSLLTVTCSLCTHEVGVKGTRTLSHINIFIHTFNSCSHPLKPPFF